MLVLSSSPLLSCGGIVLSVCLVFIVGVGTGYGRLGIFWLLWGMIRGMC